MQPNKSPHADVVTLGSARLLILYQFFLPVSQPRVSHGGVTTPLGAGGQEGGRDTTVTGEKGESSGGFGIASEKTDSAKEAGRDTKL